MTTLTLSTRIAPMGPAAAIILTDAQVDALGGGRRAPVTVTIGGRTARVRVAVMGGQNMIGLRRDVRAELGVEIGDEVTAEVTLDEAPRVVDVPPELADALAADPGAAATFDGLAYTHRKEYSAWVAQAKRPETKARRVATALERIRKGLPFE